MCPKKRTRLEIPRFFETWHVGHWFGFKSGCGPLPVWESDEKKLKTRVDPFWDALCSGTLDNKKGVGEEELAKLFDDALTFEVSQTIQNYPHFAMKVLADYDPRFAEPAAQEIIRAILDRWIESFSPSKKKSGRPRDFQGEKLDEFFAGNRELAKKIKSSKGHARALLQDDAINQAKVTFENSKAGRQAVNRSIKRVLSERFNSARIRA